MKSLSLHRQLVTDKGFILADVLVAMMLISIAIIPICWLFLQAIQTDQIARNHTTATNLAQKQLELLKTHSTEYWRNLPLSCSIPWQDKNQLPPSTYVITTTGMTSGEDPLVHVIVTVAWQEGYKERNLRFVTLYPKL